MYIPDQYINAIFHIFAQIMHFYTFLYSNIAVAHTRCLAYILQYNYNKEKKCIENASVETLSCLLYINIVVQPSINLLLLQAFRILIYKILFYLKKLKKKLPQDT